MNLLNHLIHNIHEPFLIVDCNNITIFIILFKPSQHASIFNPIVAIPIKLFKTMSNIFLEDMLCC